MDDDDDAMMDLQEFFADHEGCGNGEQITVEKDRSDTFMDVTCTCAGCDGVSFPNSIQRRVSYAAVDRFHQFLSKLAATIHAEREKGDD